VFETELFGSWRSSLSDLWHPEERSLRILTDHFRSAIVIIGDGVRPSSTGRGYVLRRLVRRALTALWQSSGELGHGELTVADLPPELVLETAEQFGQSIEPSPVLDVLTAEERTFGALLTRGRSLLRRLYPAGELTDDDYAYLHDTHGLPRELVTTLVAELGG
jgi:alanyl-tRNA synthetase